MNFQVTKALLTRLEPEPRQMLPPSVESFNLSIPNKTGQIRSLTVQRGGIVYVVGANGSGKSSLMLKLYRDHSKYGRRISAHRQNWMRSNASSLSVEQKRQMDSNIGASDFSSNTARCVDEHSDARVIVSISNLFFSENIRAHAIANAVDAKDLDKAQSLSQKPSVIQELTDLFRIANLPIKISLLNDDLVVSKSDGCHYSIAELSDGERNVLLIASSILTAEPSTIFFIDEPERHLHRSIISPFLTTLVSKRPDCAFVVSTHDITLPQDNAEAQVILVRGCTYTSSPVPVASFWDFDIVLSVESVDEALRRDIFGERRTVLFVEGTKASLDITLYKLIFPNVSVIAKASCNDVYKSVVGIRDCDTLHWINAFGIIDRDERNDEDITSLMAKGIYALDVYSVESIYYHPEIQKLLSEHQVRYTGKILLHC